VRSDFAGVYIIFRSAATSRASMRLFQLTGHETLLRATPISTKIPDRLWDAVLCQAGACRRLAIACLAISTVAPRRFL
jgi:hypothetical protein